MWSIDEDIAYKKSFLQETTIVLMFYAARFSHWITKFSASVLSHSEPESGLFLFNYAKRYREAGRDIP
ncbi:hypothetical protein D3C76_1280760 [compost metagenome]